MDDSLNIIGYRIVESDKEPDVEDGVPILKAGTGAKLQLFGDGFTDDTTLGLSSEALEKGKKCHKIVTETFKVDKVLKVLKSH